MNQVCGLQELFSHGQGVINNQRLRISKLPQVDSQTLKPRHLKGSAVVAGMNGQATGDGCGGGSCWAELGERSFYSCRAEAIASAVAVVIEPAAHGGFGQVAVLFAERMKADGFGMAKNPLDLCG
ncbi:MAG: hypothetical protein WBG32_06920 [Nodosilinea sp.]